MPRALIVGHTGQDGGILWNDLDSSGYALVGISRHEVRSARADWDRRVDVGDARAMQSLIDAFQPDQIYFLAAFHHSSEQDNDLHDGWSASWDLHVDAFANVLWAVRERPDRPRIFYASSSRVFGDAESPLQDETSPLKPVCVYGVTKAAAMGMADYFRRVHDVYVSCGILFNHESSRRAPQFVSRRIVDGLAAIKFGLAESLDLGSLDVRVDWGYAPDYTRAMRSILSLDQPGDFVIATGETHSISEFVDIAADELGLDTRRRIVESPQLLKRPAQELCGNTAKLRTACGWHPSVSFEQMVRILAQDAARRIGDSSRKK